MRCTKADSWRDSVAHCDQVAVWLLKGSKGDVLGEDVARPTLGDDAGHLGPEVPGVGGAESLAGGAPRLAGESAADDIDPTSPLSSVELSHVFVDGELWQQSFGLSRTQHLAAVGVDFDGADWRVTEQEAAENAAADAGEEVKLSHSATCKEDPGRAPGAAIGIAAGSLGISFLARALSAEARPGV